MFFETLYWVFFANFTTYFFFLASSYVFLNLRCPPLDMEVFGNLTYTWFGDDECSVPRQVQLALGHPRLRWWFAVEFCEQLAQSRYALNKVRSESATLWLHDENSHRYSTAPFNAWFKMSFRGQWSLFSRKGTWKFVLALYGQCRSFLVLFLGLIFGNFVVVKGLVRTEICIQPKYYNMSSHQWVIWVRFIVQFLKLSKVDVRNNCPLWLLVL